MKNIQLQWFAQVGCQLYVPASFLTADEATKAIVCNGCGTKGIGGYLVPDTMWGLKVTLVCNIHDWMYQNAETEEDEDLADYYFKCNLRRFIRTRERQDPWFTKLRLARANTYFFAVAATYYAPKVVKQAVRRT
jgi:hypothetical protein